jgi:signal transduction histidine kinase
MSDDLRAFDLFEGLSDEDIAEWAAITEIREAAPDDVLLEEKADSPGPLLVFEGTAVTSQGNEPLREHHGPTWIGAIAAMTEDTVPVGVTAKTPCRVAILPRDAFIALTLKHPTVHRKVMRVIGPVMRGINSREATRERLTSLGTMAAGLAHELNNPAAAARRAASDLVDAVELNNHALRTFVESGIERVDAEKLLELQKEALERCANRQVLDALDASDAVDAMEDALADREIGDAWRFAEPLAVAGLDADWVDRVQAVAGPVTKKVLAWVASSLTARELASELVESTERMSKLVKAIKTYAYMDRGGIVEADVHEGLESTLIMLAHKLKHTDIKVKRSYDKSLPKLTMHGSELNQVWTNLIDNAIGAVGESGVITVSTVADNGCVRVDIADDGPGIPAEVRSRIFDPFFTTKAPGTGTGMGLDTARRIVEQRHKGSLTFDTGEGGTTFHVWLPLEGTTR